MSGLVDRLRTGTHEQAVGLLREVQEAVKPQPSTSNRAPSARAWFVWKARFDALLRIGTPEACVGAAMMLMDDGSEFDMTNIYNVARATINMNIEGGIRYGENKCAVIALALAAAIMETRNV